MYMVVFKREFPLLIPVDSVLGRTFLSPFLFLKSGNVHSIYIYMPIDIYLFLLPHKSMGFCLLRVNKWFLVKVAWYLLCALSAMPSLKNHSFNPTVAQ